MKLHNMLDDMLDSKSKVRILRLLFRFPERDFTEREIAKMIKMSPNTVNLALSDLRKTNVFLYKRLGRTHSYRCDPDSVLFSIFKELFGRERQMRNELLNFLKEGLKGVGTGILFGSFARNEEKFDSDLDILIVTENKKDTEEKSEHLARELSARFSITLAPMIFDPAEFRKKKDKKFIREALSKGMIITGEKPET